MRRITTRPCVPSCRAAASWKCAYAACGATAGRRLTVRLDQLRGGSRFKEARRLRNHRRAGREIGCRVGERLQTSRARGGRLPGTAGTNRQGAGNIEEPEVQPPCPSRAVSAVRSAGGLLRADLLPPAGSIGSRPEQQHQDVHRGLSGRGVELRRQGGCGQHRLSRAPFPPCCGRSIPTRTSSIRKPTSSCGKASPDIITASECTWDRPSAKSW